MNSLLFPSVDSMFQITIAQKGCHIYFKTHLLTATDTLQTKTKHMALIHKNKSSWLWRHWQNTVSIFIFSNYIFVSKLCRNENIFGYPGCLLAFVNWQLWLEMWGQTTVTGAKLQQLQPVQTWKGRVKTTAVMYRLSGSSKIICIQ